MGKNQTENITGRKRFFRYAPLILWIGVIFYLSSNAGSMSNTSRFIRPLLGFLFPGASEETLLIYHGYVRKAAHLTEYGILAFWASRTFYLSSILSLQKFWYAAAFAVVLIVASIDETNQSFLGSRTGSPLDVLIDCFGGLTMIIIFALCQRYFGKSVKE